MLGLLETFFEPASPPSRKFDLFRLETVPQRPLLLSKLRHEGSIAMYILDLRGCPMRTSESVKSENWMEADT